MARLFVGGACNVGKGAICHSVAGTIRSLKQGQVVRVIEDPVERASQEHGFTFDSFVVSRIYVRAPQAGLSMIYRAIDLMSEGEPEDIVLVNESPLAILGYMTFYGFLACVSLKERTKLIEVLINLATLPESRHLFIQPWKSQRPSRLARALNISIMPFISIAGGRGEILPAQDDRNATVKQGALEALNLLGIHGGEA